MLNVLRKHLKPDARTAKRRRTNRALF